MRKEIDPAYILDHGFRRERVEMARYNDVQNRKDLERAYAAMIIGFALLWFLLFR